MKFRSLLVCVLLAAPALAPGADKQIQELQRDIGLLQQDIRNLKSANDEKFAAMLDLIKQSLEAANRANAGVAAVTTNIERSLKPLQDSLAPSLAAINSRAGQTNDDVRALQQSVGELGASVNGMQAKLDDIKRLVQTMQAPPPPPVQPAGVETTPAVADRPSMPAGDLYLSSLSDYRNARYDLAVSGFKEFLKFYGNEKQAPDAQFYIGMSHYATKHYDQAVNDFDAVLEHYTKNPRTAEATVYKGRSLVLLGKRDDGVKEFRQVMRDEPKSDQARMACDELKNLGLGCPAGTAAPHTVPKRGKK